jgi:hypothetical protein
MPYEVDAISRTVVNTHFAHALADRFNISGDVFPRAHHAADNQRLGLLIAQFGEPFAKRLGLDDLYHATIVV